VDHVGIVEEGAVGCAAFLAVLPADERLETEAVPELVDDDGREVGRVAGRLGVEAVVPLFREEAAAVVEGGREARRDVGLGRLEILSRELVRERARVPGGGPRSSLEIGKDVARAGRPKGRRREGALLRFELRLDGDLDGGVEPGGPEGAAYLKTFRRCSPSVVPLLPPTGVRGAGSLNPTPGESTLMIVIVVAAAGAASRGRRRASRRGAP
jgi:hypothetical protein